MQDSSDAEDLVKVKELLAGDSRAFEFLFEKYREKVFRIAYRFVRNKEDALEVVQDVFLNVHTGIARFKTDSKFFTWLYRIAVNRAIDFTRARKARSTVEADHEVLESQEKPLPGRSTERSPVELAQERELDEKVALAVQSLSEKHRTVFLLHASENLSYKEIAEVMKCSVGTVMSRLFYARKRLQEILGRLGVEPPGRRA